MNNIVRFSALLSIMLCFTPSVLAWTNDWQSIREATDGIHTIKSEFIQEKHLPILKKPLVSRGLICFHKPGSLRWEYQTPVSSVLITHKGDIKRFIKHEGSFQEDAGAHLEAMQIVLEEISFWLAGQFDKSPGFRATLEQAGQIVLIPKNSQITKFITRIELDLADQPGMIKTVTIFESKTSFTRLTFENTILNESIPPEVFQKP